MAEQPSNDVLRVVGFAGSLRRGSFNRALLDAAPQLAPSRTSISRIEIGDRMTKRGKLRNDADPAPLATATMASIQGGLLLTQVRRDPNQLRTALNAARNNLRLVATHERSRP